MVTGHGGVMRVGMGWGTGTGTGATHNPAAVEVRLQLALGPGIKGVGLGVRRGLGDELGHGVVLLAAGGQGGGVGGLRGADEVVASSGGLVGDRLRRCVSVALEEFPGAVLAGGRCRGGGIGVSGKNRGGGPGRGEGEAGVGHVWVGSKLTASWTSTSPQRSSRRPRHGHACGQGRGARQYRSAGARAARRSVSKRGTTANGGD